MQILYQRKNISRYISDSLRIFSDDSDEQPYPDDQKVMHKSKFKDLLNISINGQESIKHPCINIKV